GIRDFHVTGVQTCALPISFRYRPAPPALVAVDLSVEFWPGDAPVPEHGPPPEATPSPGVLDADALGNVLAGALDEVRECYRQGRARDAKLWGRVELLLTQRADGTLMEAREHQSRFPDHEVAECIAECVARLDFPPPVGGALSFIVAFRLGSPTPESAVEAPGARPMTH